MELPDCHIRSMVDRLEKTAELKQRRAAVAAFNKVGTTVIPYCHHSV